MQEQGQGGGKPAPLLLPGQSGYATVPYHVPHVLSTIYQAMGIDPAMTFPSGSGRPMYILDDRQTVSELVG